MNRGGRGSGGGGGGPMPPMPMMGGRGGGPGGGRGGYGPPGPGRGGGGPMMGPGPDYGRGGGWGRGGGGGGGSGNSHYGPPAPGRGGMPPNNNNNMMMMGRGGRSGHGYGPPPPGRGMMGDRGPPPPFMNRPDGPPRGDRHSPGPPGMMHRGGGPPPPHHYHNNNSSNTMMMMDGRRPGMIPPPPPPPPPMRGGDYHRGGGPGPMHHHQHHSQQSILPPPPPPPPPPPRPQQHHGGPGGGPMMMGGGYPPNQAPPSHHHLLQQQQQPFSHGPPHPQGHAVPGPNMMAPPPGVGFTQQQHPQMQMNPPMYQQQHQQQQMQLAYPQQQPPQPIMMQQPPGINPPLAGMPPPMQYPSHLQQQQQHQQHQQPIAMQQQGFIQQNKAQIINAQPQQVVATTNTNPDTAWMEHKSPEGISYYYNTATKQSSWERPASYLPAAAASAAASTASTTATTNAVAATSTVSSSNKSKVWQSYTDDKTGKKYYSDGVTTTWTRPAELPPENGASSSAVSASSTSKSTPTKRDDDDTRKQPLQPMLKKKKLDKSSDNMPLYANKAEAIAAFKGLLLAKDISPSSKWAEVVKLCSDDARWEACSTMGERKQALAEYQTKRANELRDVKRQEKVRAKEAYYRLLTEVLPTSKTFTLGGSGGSTSSRFIEVRDSLSKDDRFYTVEEEGTREELYYEWVEEMRKKEERNKHNKKREAKEGYLKHLKGMEDEGKLTFASTWSSFLSSLTETEKSDSRFTTSTNMSETERQLYFSDFVIELQNAEDEKQRRIRDARRRAEKAQRDAFRERLVELAKSGVVTPDTRWRGVEGKVANDPTYEPVQAQGRDVAREIFEDFVYDWSAEYRHDLVTLVRVWDMSKKDFVFDDNDANGENVENFGKMLLEASADSPALYGEIRRMSNRESPLSSIHLFFKDRKAASDSARNGHAKKRGGSANGDVSSEDEGEIIEDGEISERDDA